jgi:hypothetical protein
MTDWNLDALPKSLLTLGNPKTAKGEKEGYLTAIMHLSPSDGSSVINVCPHATGPCIAACLNKSGRGGIALDGDGINAIQAARIRRTRYFKRDRAGFMRDLAEEIRAHEKRAARHGLKPAVRLNGTSDLPFERLPHPDTQMPLPIMFAGVRFYDYTKWPLNLREASDSYHLTFSLSDDPRSESRAGDALRLGTNVAVVFAVKKGQDLPASYALDGIDAQVVDGDTTDLRFLDPAGVIVGLRAKGPAIGTRNGFVRTPA